MPRMDLEPLRRLAERCRATVRFVARFVADPEIPAIFRRADVVVLPYRDDEQSGVLYTGARLRQADRASAVGGFPEVGERDGALRLVPPGDPAALAAALAELVARPGGARASSPPPRARAAAGAVLLGRGRRAHARALPRALGPIIAAMAVLEIVFWVSAGLIVYTHVGYPLLLRALARAARRPAPPRGRAADGLADHRRLRRGGR